MFRVQSLILVLIPFALLVCVTCRSRSVGSHTATVSNSTECSESPNEHCSCSEEMDFNQNVMSVSCSDFKNFPTFNPLKINNTNLYLYISGTFEDIPPNCISPLVGEGTVAYINIFGDASHPPYSKLQVDSNAFITDYVNSITVTFFDYDFSNFSLFPTEALTVPNILSAGFYSCQMTIIGHNSFYNFDGNEIELSDSGIEEFEPYAFNGTGTLDTVIISQNPFSRFEPAFKLIRAKNLYLSNSNISTIPDYALCKCNALGGCTNIIQMLTLTNNPLVSISDSAFANLPGLTWLSMSNCSLMKIPTNAINAAPSLLLIDLSSNLITEVDSNSFVNLANLLTLILNDNPIIVIHPGAFNGLPWTYLSIQNFNNLQSVDAAVTYGMKKAWDLVISNCSNFEEITLNDYTQLPDSLNVIFASGSNVKRVSSNLDFWLQLNYANSLFISDNYNYNCTPDIQWMSKYVFCPYEQIIMNNTKCADTNQILLESYLQQLEPNPLCIQHSSATFLKNSTKLFMLCILFICFYLFATFN